jgi:hypothetical protein
MTSPPTARHVAAAHAPPDDGGGGAEEEEGAAGPRAKRARVAAAADGAEAKALPRLGGGAHVLREAVGLDGTTGWLMAAGEKLRTARLFSIVRASPC